MIKVFFEILLAGLLIAGIYVGYSSRDQETPPPPVPEVDPMSTVAFGDTDEPNPLKLALENKGTYSELDKAAMQAIHARFATGNFEAALLLADQAAENNALSEPFHSWLRSQLPALLTSAGWHLLKTGSCETATSLFLRAEHLSKSKESRKGLAVCYYKLRNFIAASEWFQSYLGTSPDDTQMKILFTDVLESEGRFQEAVEILDQIVAKQAEDLEEELPDQDALNQRLESMRSRAKESTHQLKEHSRHFNLSYRAQEHEGLVSYVLETLELALDEYVQNFGFEAPTSPIDVILYKKDNFQEMVVGGPDWAVGLFDGRLRIPIGSEVIDSQYYKGLFLVLRHELVHALFASKSDHRSLPPWIDEGIAQRLACIAQEGGCPDFKFPATPGELLSMRLFVNPFTSLSSVRAGRAYRQSLYLIYTLEKLHGSAAIVEVVKSVGKSGKLDSNSLLARIPTSFRTLHGEATKFWHQRIKLTNSNN